MTSGLTEYDRVYALISEARATIGAIDLQLKDVSDAADLISLAKDLDEVARDAGIVRDGCHHAAGEAMGQKRLTVDGQVWERSKTMRRRDWQSDDLLRVILDSRLADSNGEVVDETPLQKVKDVYGLRGYNTKLGALRARGIDPDDYSSVEWGTWKVGEPHR